ncbi:MAG: hypothetical protein QXT94_02425 [Methanothrix sp.]|jgi:nitrate reductase NapE component
MYSGSMASHRREKTTEKPTAAYMLVFIGGMFVLAGGILTAIFGSFWGFMMFRGFYYGAFSLVWMIGIVSGAMMIVAASKFNVTKRHEIATWSAVALIFTVLSVADMGGFGIGFILGLIGSILGLASGSNRQ